MGVITLLLQNKDTITILFSVSECEHLHWFMCSFIASRTCCIKYRPAHICICFWLIACFVSFLKVLTLEHGNVTIHTPFFSKPTWHDLTGGSTQAVSPLVCIWNKWISYGIEMHCVGWKVCVHYWVSAGWRVADALNFQLVCR